MLFYPCYTILSACLLFVAGEPDDRSVAHDSDSQTDRFWGRAPHLQQLLRAPPGGEPRVRGARVGDGEPGGAPH